MPPKNVFELTKRINRDKFVPLVGCFALKERMIKVFKEINVKVIEFPLKKIYGYHALKNGIKLFNFIKKENIKIVQSFHLLPDIYVPIIAKIAGVPIIISSRRDLGFDKNLFINIEDALQHGIDHSWSVFQFDNFEEMSKFVLNL